MSEEFNLIRYLTVARDKGVIIWILNIGAEKYWNYTQSGVIDRSEDRIVGRVEEMNLLLCRPQDIMILRKQPDPYYLDRLKEWGFSVPRILVPQESDDDTPISELIWRDSKLLRQLADIRRDQSEVYLIPYGVTRLEEQIAEKCGLHIQGASSQVHAVVNDKIFNRITAQRLGFEVCQGNICGSAEEIRQAYDKLTGHPPYFDKVIIKEPYGASGKGLYIIDSEEQLTSLLSRIKRVSRMNAEARWLVEGWYRKKADLNYQIYVSPSGEAEVFSMKEQILRDTVYIGSYMPAELDDEVEQSVHDFGKAIGQYLHSIGYTGVVGVDSIITEEDVIIPVIEINGRFTLSTYISFVRHVLGKRMVFSRYFKVLTHAPCSHRMLCEALEQEGMLYKPGRGEGVIIYTSGTLPHQPDPGSGLFPGRIFVLITARDRKSIEHYNIRFERFVSGLMNRKEESK